MGIKWFFSENQLTRLFWLSTIKPLKSTLNFMVDVNLDASPKKTVLKKWLPTTWRAWRTWRTWSIWRSWVLFSYFFVTSHGACGCATTILIGILSLWNHGSNFILALFIFSQISPHRRLRFPISMLHYLIICCSCIHEGSSWRCSKTMRGESFGVLLPQKWCNFTSNNWNIFCTTS